MSTYLGDPKQDAAIREAKERLIVEKLYFKFYTLWFKLVHSGWF